LHFGKTIATHEIMILSLQWCKSEPDSSFSCSFGVGETNFTTCCDDKSTEQCRYADVRVDLHDCIIINYSFRSNNYCIIRYEYKIIIFLAIAWGEWFYLLTPKSSRELKKRPDTVQPTQTRLLQLRYNIIIININ